MNTLPRKFFSLAWGAMTGMAVGIQMPEVFRKMDDPLQIIGAATILLLLYGILSGLLLYALLWIAQRDDETGKSITETERVREVSLGD